MCELYDRNGVLVTSEQGILNVLRVKYESMEEAYLIENKILEKPKCKCGDNLPFETFFKGYKSYCKKCSKKKSIESLKKREECIEAFIKFYYANINLYPDYKESLSNTNVFEPFLKRYTLSYTIYGYINKYFKNYFKDVVVSCVKCKKTSKISFFTKKFICGSKVCRGLRRYSDNRKEKEIKKEYDWNNRDIKYDYTSKITGELFNLSKKYINDFFDHLYTSNISPENYIKVYEPDKIRRCLECNIELEFNYKNPLTPYQQRTKFCSHQHYIEYKRKHPGIIQSCESEGKRLEKSKLLKEKILSGEWTPKNNKWHNWFYSDIGKYRSRWELVWHKVNPHLEYETLRLKYIYNGKEHVYIIDFVDKINKILYEIKPSSEVNLDKNIEKRNAALKYCDENNYQYIIISEDKILEVLMTIKNKDMTEGLWNLKKNLQKQLKLKE